MKATKFSEYLQDREQLQYIDVPHWIYVLTAVIWAALILLVGLWGSVYAFGLAFAAYTPGESGLVDLIYTGMRWVAVAIQWASLVLAAVILIKRIIFYLTTYVFASERRLFVKSGLLLVDVQEINFDEIRKLHINYGVFGRILGYGKLNMDARFVKDFHIPFVYNPEPFAKLINHENDLVKDVNLSFATGGMNDDGSVGTSSETEAKVPHYPDHMDKVNHFERPRRDTPPGGIPHPVTKRGEKMDDDGGERNEDGDQKDSDNGKESMPIEEKTEHDFESASGDEKPRKRGKKQQDKNETSNNGGRPQPNLDFDRD